MRRLILAGLVGFTVLCGAPAVAAVSVAGSDLNCADFGTRERAQRELDSRDIDVHDLDRDDDGRACESNGSTGWWVWPISSAGLLAGRNIARRRLGDYTMMPGVEGAIFNYRFAADGSADKVVDRANLVLLVSGLAALPVMGFMRDMVLPRSATPIAVYVATGAMSAVFMWVATMATGARRDVSTIEHE